MAAPKPIGRLISHVILDLDGTLLNTGDWNLGLVDFFRRLVNYDKFISFLLTNVAFLGHTTCQILL
jgi:phosphoglycolate phosphatase-like HAD superfamily hydrolase